METKNIRNICLIGHGNNGKTSLAESMLYCTGAIDRMGKVADGTTVCDYDAEETARQITIATSIAPVNFAGNKINVLDCPGYFDFVGDVLCALRAVTSWATCCAPCALWSAASSSPPPRIRRSPCPSAAREAGTT